MYHSREGRRDLARMTAETSLRGLEYGERDGAVREVSEPENERNERTVEAGREGLPDETLTSHAHGIGKAGESPSLIMAVSIASVPCMMASRGLPFLTTALKTSIQCFDCNSDLSGVSCINVCGAQTSPAVSVSSPSTRRLR